MLQSETIPEAMKAEMREEMKAALLVEYGMLDIDEKFARWEALIVPALCAPVEYLDLLHEVETSYVQGAFYPALTGACCLGERILNHLLLRVREHKKV